MIKPTGIGRRIRDTRQDLGLSQAELGRLLNPPVTRQRVSRYESDGYQVKIPTIYRLAVALGVEPIWLAWGRK